MHVMLQRHMPHQADSLTACLPPDLQGITCESLPVSLQSPKEWHIHIPLSEGVLMAVGFSSAGARMGLA